MISSVLVGYVFFLLIFCFLFFYLNNADVENCGEVRGFCFIYILVLCPCIARLNKKYFDNINKLNNK